MGQGKSQFTEEELQDYEVRDFFTKIVDIKSIGYG